MRWDQGRVVIGRMLAGNELQRVPASREQADRLISQADKHLASAAEICAQDPAGGYALLYDAARKALAATLENQGLRATTRGGHVALYEAVRAQLDPPMGQIIRPFDRRLPLMMSARTSPKPPVSSTWANASLIKCRRSDPLSGRLRAGDAGREARFRSRRCYTAAVLDRGRRGPSRAASRGTAGAGTRS
jgi:hypothetical protein